MEVEDKATNPFKNVNYSVTLPPKESIFAKIFQEIIDSVQLNDSQDYITFIV